LAKDRGKQRGKEMSGMSAQNQESNYLASLQGITKNDGITDSLNCYGDLIRALAGKSTDSPEEAENMVREIFLTLLENTGRAGSTNFDEIIFISIIARRHFIERANRAA
jgi:DNA-directed RNA polymerase specialized sigma24 family protein